MKAAIIAVILGVAVIGGGYVVSSLEKVGQGEVGVVYTMADGVDEETLNPGYHFVGPLAKVKTYRNDIMHAHSMKTSKYKDAINLIKKINKQLELEIGKLVGREGNLMNENAEDFNLSLGDALKDMDQMQALKNWQENLVSLQSSIHTIKSENVIQALNTLANAIDLNEVKAIQQNLHEIMQIQLDIPSAISELKRLGSSMQESVPPALLELQKSLEAFKPTPAILKLSQNLKESKGDNSNDQDEI